MDMTINFLEGKKVSVDYRGHTIHTDQHETAGGDGSAPAPFDLLLASIGACAGFYVQVFCRKRNISLENVRMMLRNEKDPASGLVGRVTIEVTVDRDFPEKYLTTLKSVIDQCTVKKQLLNPPEFEILINGPP
jgi:putative redox protein